MLGGPAVGLTYGVGPADLLINSPILSLIYQRHPTTAHPLVNDRLYVLLLSVILRSAYRRQEISSRFKPND